MPEHADRFLDDISETIGSATERWMLRAGMFPREYMGMGYEQASREGARLIERAHRTGEWHSIVEKLLQLRTIMHRLRELVSD